MQNTSELYIGIDVHKKSWSVNLRTLVRSYLIEAAWTAVRRDMVLQEYYRSHSGKPANKIIVKVARKLLSRIWHVIKNEVYYQSGVK